MIGRTLAFYFAGRFAKMVLAMFILFFMLIATISYFEVVLKVLRDDERQRLACGRLWYYCAYPRFRNMHFHSPRCSGRSPPSSRLTGDWRSSSPVLPAFPPGNSFSRQQSWVS